MGANQQCAACKWCAKQQTSIPANLILLVLLQDAELRGGQVTRLAEVPDLLLNKHEPLKAEEPVVLIGVPGIHMLVEFACEPAMSSSYNTSQQPSMTATIHCRERILRTAGKGMTMLSFAH